jgi:hypothetical protein
MGITMAILTRGYLELYLAVWFGNSGLDIRLEPFRPHLRVWATNAQKALIDWGR